jgi:hypothetical protein
MKNSDGFNYFTTCTGSRDVITEIKWVENKKKEIDIKYDIKENKDGKIMIELDSSLKYHIEKDIVEYIENEIKHYSIKESQAENVFNKINEAIEYNNCSPFSYREYDMVVGW